MASALVLDNVALSAFATGGWFHSFSFWDDSYELLTPQTIWEEEFAAYHESHAVDSVPRWLSPVAPETQIDTAEPGALSDNDWRCIVLAKEHDGMVITRDQKLREVALDREIETEWLGKFVLQTFERCGIARSAYEAGIDDYLQDSYLPAASKTELREAEKRE
ncbi:hypothetical protein ACFQL9_13255 [Halobaculum lipolyticum]|uniref:PIN domain-containing protein n=1 Tax=Halobaculum lipolyticum TaxID=3032001 RepID=A0ABD5WGD0_9EURY